MSLCLQDKRGYLEWGNFSNEVGPAIKYNYNTGFYKVSAEEIKMEGVDLLNKPAMDQHKGIMIDSGATACVFPEA